MDYLLTNKYNWGHFVTALVVLLGVYFLIKLLLRIGKNISFVGKAQVHLIRFLKHTLLIYEPVAIVILAAIFIMISPLIHGIIIALSLIGAMGVLRNYVNGRIMLYDEAISMGSPLRTREIRGTITNMGRLGLKVRSKQGIHFINYQSLMRDGYTITSREKVGGNYKLAIIDIREDREESMEEALHHLLVSAPFIESEEHLDIDVNAAFDKKAKVNLSIRNKEHLFDLMALLHEQGYEGSIIKA